ncbi:LuxR C-terminal-related transcriptional regulator [Streptacidiphilus fuscans]|uniref:Response regulator transcription factor n=1 Tax=Streptacidiphilus fuscans TaxID=2789292 RepID=A0A931BA94_9ACTN|nr:response regulator transcription factor [Streptacidiphilus fuscans]MBF9069750.1 response regulator transcription factor [Streptacidiphilus fuscans]
MGATGDPAHRAAPADAPGRGDGPGLRTLVVADASRLLAEALALVLSGRGYRVLATAATRDGLLRAVTACRPDACLLDLQLLDGEALDTVREIHAREPGIRVIVLSRTMDPDSASAAIEAGAVGYLGKDRELDVLDRALRTVAAGGRFIEPTLSPQTQSPQTLGPQAQSPVAGSSSTGDGGGEDPLHRLTDREREVLRLLVEGEDTAAIAEGLRMSPSTARTHVQNVLDKLGVHSRLEAVALARRSDVWTGTR